MKINNGYDLSDEELDKYIQESDLVTQILGVNSIEECKESLTHIDKGYKVVYANFYEDQRTLSLGLKVDPKVSKRIRKLFKNKDKIQFKELNRNEKCKYIIFDICRVIFIVTTIMVLIMYFMDYMGMYEFVIRYIAVVVVSIIILRWWIKRFEKKVRERLDKETYI